MNPLLLALGIIILASPGRLAISVHPRVTFAGRPVSLVCLVQRHPDNRRLRMGVEGVSTSERQLDGSAALVQYSMTIPATCDSPRFFCELTTSRRQTVVAATTINVAGCS